MQALTDIYYSPMLIPYIILTTADQCTKQIMSNVLTKCTGFAPQPFRQFYLKIKVKQSWGRNSGTKEYGRVPHFSNSICWKHGAQCLSLNWMNDHLFLYNVQGSSLLPVFSRTKRGMEYIFTFSNGEVVVVISFVA